MRISTVSLGLSAIKPQNEMETTIIYEVFDSLTNAYVEDTENLEKALEYHDKGYLIVEHLVTIYPITNTEKFTVTHSKQW